MLTLKHVESCGHEGLMQARELVVSPDRSTVTAFGVPGPDEGARRDGVVTFSSSRIYVMNDNGKTVAVYDLRAAEPSRE